MIFSSVNFFHRSFLLLRRKPNLTLYTPVRCFEIRRIFFIDFYIRKSPHPDSDITSVVPFENRDIINICLFRTSGVSCDYIIYYYSRTVNIYTHINTGTYILHYVIKSVSRGPHKDSHEVFSKRRFFLRSRAQHRNVIFSSVVFFRRSFLLLRPKPPLRTATIMTVRCYEIRRIFLVISICIFFTALLFFGGFSVGFFLLDPVDPHRTRTTHSSWSSHGRGGGGTCGVRLLFYFVLFFSEYFV